jgi:hypothetical protein
MWHALILFTRRYAEFCDILGRFIHHRPRVRGEWYRTGILERYELFNQRYEETFGESPPTDIWPRPEEIALRIGEDLPPAALGGGKHPGSPIAQSRPARRGA